MEQRRGHLSRTAQEPLLAGRAACACLQQREEPLSALMPMHHWYRRVGCVLHRKASMHAKEVCSGLSWSLHAMSCQLPSCFWANCGQLTSTIDLPIAVQLHHGNTHWSGTLGSPVGSGI